MSLLPVTFPTQEAFHGLLQDVSEKYLTVTGDILSRKVLSTDNLSDYCRYSQV